MPTAINAASHRPNADAYLSADAFLDDEPQAQAPSADAFLSADYFLGPDPAQAAGRRRGGTRAEFRTAMETPTTQFARGAGGQAAVDPRRLDQAPPGNGIDQLIERQAQGLMPNSAPAVPQSRFEPMTNVSPERAAREEAAFRATSSIAPGAMRNTDDLTKLVIDAGQAAGNGPLGAMARGAMGGVAGLAEVGPGFVTLAGDILGSDGVSKFGKEGTTIAKGAGDQLEQFNRSELDKRLYNITSSAVQSLPTMAFAAEAGPMALVGGRVVTSPEVVKATGRAMSTLYTQTFGQEYGEARTAGKDPVDSAARAGIFAAAEVMGEMLGLKEQWAILRGGLVRKGLPAGQLPKLIANDLIKEIPGEELTTLTQFLADKYGPAAMNPNATLQDYLKQAMDTAIDTVGQTALMSGPATARRAARNVYGRAEGAINASAGPAAQLEAEVAAAIRDGVANTFFKQDAVDGFARRAATDPNFTDPTIVDPQRTVRQADDVGPSAPAGSMPTVEAMPSRPFTQEQVATLALAGQADREAQQTQEPAEQGDRGQGLDAMPIAQPTPASQAREAVADAPAGPGQIRQGAIAALAQQRLAERDAAGQSPAAQAPQVDSQVAQHEVGVVSSTASTNKPAGQQVQQPPRKVRTPSDASGQANQAGGQVEPKTAPAMPAAPTQTFSSRGRALAWVVEHRMNATHAPVQIGDQWAVRPKDEHAAVSTTATPPAQPAAPAARDRATRPVPARQAPPVDAAHIEPDRAPAPATAPEVAGSLSKAASNVDASPAQMRRNLIDQIDAAIGRALDDGHPDVQQFEHESRSKPDRAKLQRQGLVGAALDRRMAGVQAQIDERKAKVSDRIGYVEFDVPGDGLFKVLNTRAKLAEFRAKVQASAGFKAARTATPEEYPGVQHGSPSTKAAIEAMLDDNDPQAAADYAAAKGVDIRAIGLSPARTAKLSGITPTSAVDTGRAEGEAPAEPRAGQLDVLTGQQARQQSADQVPRPSPKSEADQPAAGSAEVDALRGVMPWELTQEQFLRTVDFRNSGSGSRPWTAWWRDTQLEGSPTAFDHPDLGATTVMGERFFKTRRDAMVAARQAHERAVRRAQMANDAKPVPAPKGSADTGQRPEDAGREAKVAEKAQVPLQWVDPKSFDGRMVNLTLDDGSGSSAEYEADAGKLLADLDGRISALRLDGALTNGIDMSAVAEKTANLVSSGMDVDAARKEARADLVEELHRSRVMVAEAAAIQHADLRNLRPRAERQAEIPDPGAAQRLAGKRITLDLNNAHGETDAGEAIKSYDDRIHELQAGRAVAADAQELGERIAVLLAAGTLAEQAATMARTAMVADLLHDRGVILDLALKQHAQASTPTSTRQIIADVGEKIGGARKDWRQRGLTVADLDGMSEAEGAELVTKANAWRPDYQAIADAAEGDQGRTVAATIKVVYDSLAAQPKVDTPQGRRDYLQAMQAVRRVYGAVRTVEQARNAYLDLRRELGVSSESFARTEQDQAARRVLFSVYKGRSDPFTIGRAAVARVRKLLDAGFPAKAEPWTRRYEVIMAGGPGTTDSGINHYVARTASLGTPMSAEQVAAGFHLVLTKRTRQAVAAAPTMDDAKAAAKALHEGEQGGDDTKKSPDRPHLDRLTREGLPVTIDRDVRAEDFMQAFGFRAIEFGNWTAQDERQKLLNMAFDGLHDLAQIIGVPPQALSLNGTLGMAFGARGGGRFAAHYEPGKLVINMTKLQGGGSMAHEWAHAFDHYFGELDRSDAYQGRARGASGWYTKAEYTGQPQRRLVNEGGKWVAKTDMRLGNLRPEVANAIDAVMRALYTGQQTKEAMLRELETGIEVAQSRANEAEVGSPVREVYERRAQGLRDMQRQVQADPDGTTYPKGQSVFAAEARKLSGKSSDGYWLRPTEMFARAFEAYTFDRLVAMGAKSEYLVHGVESERFAGGEYKGNPFPTGEERAAINRAFDALFKTIQTRPTDKGLAMFSRQPDPAEANALRALSENDELFALPKSDKTTVEGIAADIDPQIKVTPRTIPGEQRYDLTMPDGKTARLVVRKPNPYGPTLYGFDQVDGEMSSVLHERPGDNPEDVPHDKEDVYIDASLLERGGAGGVIYQIAATYAHNTGRIFIGDPAGLSDEALRRRSEQMLSSALKFGTTEHLAPHPRQVAGDAALGVPPLRWIYGDDHANIRRLIEVNLAALHNAGIDDSSISFDIPNGQFLDSAGQPISRAGIDALGSSTDLGSRALAAGRTIARGAVLRALLREEGAASEGQGRRDGLLARLAGLAGHAGEATAGIFYARAGRFGASPTQGLSPGEVRAIADAISTAWRNAPGITVLATMADAPQVAKRTDELQRAGGATGSPSAFYLGGRVYLVADQLRDAVAVEEAVLHEALGHAGLRGVFGPELGQVLDDVATLRPDLVERKAKAYGLDVTQPSGRRVAAEEALAELAQTEPKATLVQRALAAIRAWLRRVMPGLHELALSDAEIIIRFIEPARQFVIDGGQARADAAPAYQRPIEAQPYYSALARALAGANINTAPPAGWKQTAKGLTSKGVKAAELEWSGLNEWLDLQGERKVGKQEVLAYLDANGVRVDQTVIGGDAATAADVSIERGDDGWWSVMVGEHEWDSMPDRADAERAAATLKRSPRELAKYTGVHYPGVSQPAGRHHRELVLSLPSQAEEVSDHWPGMPGVIAHVRYNERDDTDGRRVLFVEDLQSDWSDALRAARRGDAAANVPAGPFVGSDAWISLAIKAITRQAVVEGFDRVAFATGSQVADIFPFKDSESGSTLAARSRFYGEADGSVVDAKGQRIDATPVLRNAVRDVLKKLGGGQVQTLVLRDVGKKTTRQMGFDITDAMREAVHAGLPLFARKGGGTQVDGFKRWLEANADRDTSMLPPATHTEVHPDQRPVDDKPRAVDTTSDAFRDWFDGSKAVDALGRPLKLHVGADRKGRVSSANRGPFGAGVYLSTNKDHVGHLFEDEKPVLAYAALRNPYLYADARIEVPGGWKLGAGGMPKSAAAGLIQAVMPEASAKVMLNRLRHGKTEFGDTLTKRLIELGHDGLVVKYANPQDGATQYIAFHPSQVMAAEIGQDDAEAGSNGVADEEVGAVRFQRTPADFTLREFGRAGRFIEVVQDRYNRWRQVIEDVKGQGGTITDENDFYRAEERYWGNVGTRLEAFHAELKDFVRAVAKDGLSLDDVAIFAVAQHAEERNEAVARKRKDMPDGGSGMLTEDADQILESARQAGLEEPLTRHAARLREWIQGTREVLRDGGLISDRDYGAWVDAYEHYVPLRGIDGQRLDFGAGRTRYSKAGGFNVKGEEGHEAHGRHSQARHIIETIIQDRARALVRVGKNDVLRAFGQFVLDNPSPSLWRIESVDAGDATELDDDGGDRSLIEQPAFSDERTITFKDGGQEVRIQVLDDRLLRQLRHMDVEVNPSWVVAALQWANRKLSHLYTSLSPTFTVINGLRDVQAATVGIIDEIGFMAAPKLLAKMPSALKEAWQAEAGTMSKDYQLYAAMGGQTHFFALKTLDAQADELQRLVREADRSPVDPRTLGHAALRLIEAINGGIENATRLAAFKTARESGKSEVQAASIAKNITVNFNRKGTQQLASAWVLFFNPAVQDAAMITRRLANPKVLATLGTAMLGVAALALRNAAMGDDDDGVAWWDKIPDEVKERNFVIVLPPGVKAGEVVPGSKVGRYVKIPMPYGYSAFPVLANQIVDVWRHAVEPKRGRDLLHGAVKAFGGMMNAVMPVPELTRAVSADSKEAAGKSLVLAAVPDALNPVAQAALNINAFGRKLYPDGQRERNMPDSTQFFPGQAGTAFQRAAEGLNKATGGNRYSSGAVDLAPATIENLVRGYGGGPVGFGLDLVNAMYARQSIARPELDAKRLPFVKQFYSTIDAETDRLTGYQRLEAAEKVVDPLRHARIDGAGEEARELLKKAGPMAGLGDAVLVTRQQLARIVKAELQVVNDAKMPDDLKFVRLQVLAEQRRKALQGFNAAYDRAVEATARVQEAEKAGAR